MNGTELKGKGILKVVGILYIVFAALSILVGLLGLLGGGLLAVGGLGAEAYIGAGLGFAAILGSIVLILSNVLGLVTGILGVKWCARADKAQTLFILGAVLVVLAVWSLISAISGGSGVWSAALGLVLPALYTWGAYQNKQSV
ncbi:hypothetical protein CE91St44_06930 [Oscillospiraceae bacterium]|nr:hypothetical protein CE91St44_06930 [Oscillospiraceae bacterium]